MRDGSITLDDYEAQSLEVARLVGLGLFMIWIDHMIYDDQILSSTLTTNLVLTTRLEIQTDRILPIVSHMRWSMFAVARFREMCSRPIPLS